MCPSVGERVSYVQWTPPTDYSLDTESRELLTCPTAHTNPHRNLLNKRRLCTKSARCVHVFVSNSTGQVHLAGVGGA